MTDNTMQIFREIPFFCLKKGISLKICIVLKTKRRLKTMKNDMRDAVTYLLLLLCSVLAGRMLVVILVSDFYLIFILPKHYQSA